MFKDGKPDQPFSILNTKKQHYGSSPQMACTALSPDWVPGQADKLYQGKASCHSHKVP